jgi:hypothetical protein
MNCKLLKQLSKQTNFIDQTKEEILSVIGLANLNKYFNLYFHIYPIYTYSKVLVCEFGFAVYTMSEVRDIKSIVYNFNLKNYPGKGKLQFSSSTIFSDHILVKVNYIKYLWKRVIEDE